MIQEINGLNLTHHSHKRNILFFLCMIIKLFFCDCESFWRKIIEEVGPEKKRKSWYS
jgi:hypothetical protein